MWPWPPNQPPPGYDLSYLVRVQGVGEGSWAMPPLHADTHVHVLERPCPDGWLVPGFSQRTPCRAVHLADADSIPPVPRPTKQQHAAINHLCQAARTTNCTAPRSTETSWSCLLSCGATALCRTGSRCAWSVAGWRGTGERWQRACMCIAVVGRGLLHEVCGMWGTGQCVTQRHKGPANPFLTSCTISLLFP